MLSKYLKTAALTAPLICEINTEDYRSMILKEALISYGTIRLRLRNLNACKQSSGKNIIDWDTPLVDKPCRYIEDWVDSILHTLKVECDSPSRAAAYFYHRIYSTVATKKAMSFVHPDLCGQATPEEFDELIRLVFVELPHLYNDLKAV